MLIFVLSQCKDKFSTNLTTSDKSVDGVLGTRTWGSRMEGTDESYGGAPNPILVAQTGHQYFTQKTLTVGGSITVRLVSSFTILD